VQHHHRDDWDQPAAGVIDVLDPRRNVPAKHNNLWWKKRKSQQTGLLTLEDTNIKSIGKYGGLTRKMFVERVW